MKILSSLVAAGILTLPQAHSAPVTTQTTSYLRGRKVVRTRTEHHHHTQEGLKPENHNHQDSLVDPQPHQSQRLKGTADSGQVRHGHRTDSHLGHHDTHDHQYNHFETHEEVEDYLRHHHVKKDEEKEQKTEKKQKKQSFAHKRKNETNTEKSPYALPTGLAAHFNETLFEVLHNAPYQVYEDAMGHHEVAESGSFPVFSVPEWYNITGIFSGFSKMANPLIFENAQFLLQWNDIVAASSGASDELKEFMGNNNFHASLIIGKSFGNSVDRTSFLGLMVSYYQYGVEKNVLIPFARLEDFFDDKSEQHLLDPETKSLEVQALQEMIDKQRSNNTQFYHPAMEVNDERKQQIEDLEIIHFQKLFQLLIRRSFLFSFGYADCLLSESDHLRECLEDTFYSVVKMETSIRGALDDQIVERMAEINGSFNSKVREACIMVEGTGTGMLYGSGSCKDTNGLSSFVRSYSSF